MTYSSETDGIIGAELAYKDRVQLASFGLLKETNLAGINWKTCDPTSMLTKPSYYKRGNIEAFDVIDAWELDFYEGNVIKYLCRAGHKTESKYNDLMKAKEYLEKAIKKHNPNVSLDTAYDHYNEGRAEEYRMYEPQSVRVQCGTSAGQRNAHWNVSAKPLDYYPGTPGVGY
jgi:hypothetical protein